ncbi:hypothetical protein, partial [Actinoallomurus acaciae]
MAAEVGGHARVVADNNVGEARDRFKSFADALQGGGEEGGLVWLAQACDGLAVGVDNVVAQKNAGRLQWTLTFEFLLVMWAVAALWSAVTAGGSVEAATVASRAAGLGLKRFLWQVAKAAVMGGVFAGGMD